MSVQPRIIKKYQNRRLYDTAESRYIGLSDILDLIRLGVPFKVIDTKTEDDVTRNVLIQIILEQESGDKPLFSNDMLENFIRHYDEGTRQIFSEYLERNFQLFADQQQLMQEQMGKFVGHNPFDNLTNMAQSNMDFWQRMQTNFLKSSGLYPTDKSEKS